MKKLKVAVFFGGRSAEHEVSVVSARNIANALSHEKYDVTLVGISDSGEWILFPSREIPKNIKRADELATKDFPRVALANLGTGRVGLINFSNNNSSSIDVAFPVLHGPFGEDGTIQGLFKSLGVAFVGPSVIGSAIGMDKEVMKRLLIHANLPVARYALLRKNDPKNFDEIVRDLGLPFFIKPASLGSSIGVFKIKSKGEFDEKLAEAFKYDEKILAEEFIVGREIEFGVLGDNRELIASPPGEIIPKHEFYSYEAKYLDADGAILKVPAELEESLISKGQALAKQVFSTLECSGMARVDFFLTKDGRFYINEINTIPGFTSISQYPMLMKLAGYQYPQLLDRLIDLGLQRFSAEQALQTRYPGA